MRKNYFALVLGVLVVFLMNQALAAPTDVPLNRGIIVTGTSSIEKEPDQTVIQFTILTTGKKREEVQAENNQIASRVASAFFQAGVERKDWKTIQLNVGPLYDYNSKGESKQNGYQMTHQIIVTLPGVTQAGKIVNLLVDSGVTNIDSIQFTLKDQNGAFKEALVEATKEAREKAEIMAAASGAKIKGVRYIGTPIYQYRPYNEEVSPKKYAVADMAVREEQQVWASTVDVNATIQIHFDLVE